MIMPVSLSNRKFYESLKIKETFGTACGKTENNEEGWAQSWC